MSENKTPKLRSAAWFDNPGNPGMTALYIERYLNFGITREELQSGKPIIGIAQTGSDLSPCNRHHLELAKRVREGIRDAGGVEVMEDVRYVRDGNVVTAAGVSAGIDMSLWLLGEIYGPAFARKVQKGIEYFPAPPYTAAA